MITAKVATTTKPRLNISYLHNVTSSGYLYINTINKSIIVLTGIMQVARIVRRLLFLSGHVRLPTSSAHFFFFVFTGRLNLN